GGEAGVVERSVLLSEFADRPEPPVLQLAYVEMSAWRLILRPAKEDVARRLHDMLTFDDPPAGVTIEFGPEAFEHRSSCFFDLKEQRRAVPAHEQTNRAKRPHASDTD